MPERIVRSGSARARTAAKTEVGKRQANAKMTHRGEVLEEVTQEQRLGESSFPPGVEPAFVRVAVGQTYNLTNFESLRLDVSVTLPCRVEDVEDTYLRASEFVAEKLLEEETQWLGTRPKSNSKR
jgi:hypothetical protein